MNWTDFNPKDPFEIKVQRSQMNQDLREIVDWSDPSIAGHAISIRNDDHECVGCIGILPMWDGVAQAWTIFSDEVLARPAFIARGVAGWMAFAERKYKLRRLQTTVEAGQHKHRRFILWLGFVYEGTMHSYGPDGHSHDIYARIKGRRVH